MGARRWPDFLAGKHYSLRAAQPGPAATARIGIFIGSYKPRMLRLTGRLGDGWIPTSSYASPEELVGMQQMIDDAATDAGRVPADVRRWYNVMGSFTSREGGFLQGRASLWVEQLTELALEQGVSGFIIAPGTPPNQTCADSPKRLLLIFANGWQKPVAPAFLPVPTPS